MATALFVMAFVVVGSAAPALADCTTTATTVAPLTSGADATVSSSDGPLASTSEVGTAAASSSLASTGADLPIEVGAAVALALAGSLIVVLTTRRRGRAVAGARTPSPAGHGVADHGATPYQAKGHHATDHQATGHDATAYDATAYDATDGAVGAARSSSWRAQKAVWRSVAVLGTLAVLTSIFVVRAADPVSAAPRPLSVVSTQLAEDCTTPIVAPADSLPEVPVAAALPVEAALIAGVVVFVTRRRAFPRYVPAHAKR